MSKPLPKSWEPFKNDRDALRFLRLLEQAVKWERKWMLTFGGFHPHPWTVINGEDNLKVRNEAGERRQEIARELDELEDRHGTTWADPLWLASGIKFT